MSPRIKWDVEWVLERFESAESIKDLLAEYNEAHGTDIGYRTFKGFCQRQGLRKSRLTAEQDAFIREMYPMLGTVALTEAFNERFYTGKTPRQMRSLVGNRGLKILDEDIYRRCRNECRDRKYEIGEMTQGWQQPYVKVGENKFVRIERYLWEQKNGEIPKGYRVIHLDGNSENYNIENLQAIPSAYCAKLCRNKLYSHHPLITKGAIMCFELQDKIAKENEQ